MSTTIFWAVIFPAVYLLLGAGTSRTVFTQQYKKYFPKHLERTEERYSSYYKLDPHELTTADDSVFGPALFAFWLWPFFLIWLLLIKPIGTVVFPLAVKWYTAPAKRAVSS